MNQAEYEEWKEDLRVGLCPFCSAPGWVMGETDWCEHYIGCTNLWGPVLFPCFEDLPFADIQMVTEALSNLDADQRSFILSSLDVEAASYLNQLLEYRHCAYAWIRPWPTETLRVEISEYLFDDIYYSYFVLDLQARLAELRPWLQAILEILLANPLTKSLLDSD
jgi:hypothetical protein